MHNKCLVDLQFNISDAKMLNTNAKCWEKETSYRAIA